MISEPGDGRIYVTTPDGLWSFNSSAHNVPRAAFDALRERCEKLESEIKLITNSYKAAHDEVIRLRMHNTTESAK